MRITCHQSPHHGESEGDEDGEKLVDGLLAGSVSQEQFRHAETENQSELEIYFTIRPSVLHCQLLREVVVRCRSGNAGHHDRDDGPEESRHPVEVVDAAAVVDLQLLLEGGLDVVEAEGGEDPGQGPHHDGPARGEHHVGRGPHGHTAGQGGVLDVLHAHLPAGGEEGADDHGGDDAATQGVVGVDQSSLLGVTTGRGSCVKAGPVHPQEDRPHLQQGGRDTF